MESTHDSRSSNLSWRRHQVVAIFVSLVFPGLGLSYLGVPRQSEQIDASEAAWANTSGRLYSLALLALLWANWSVFRFQFLIFLLLVWCVCVVLSAFKDVPILLRAKPSVGFVPKPWSLLLPFVLIAIAVSSDAAAPLRAMTILRAPPASSPLLPTGTLFYAVNANGISLNIRRGQMVVYRDGTMLRLGRVIGEAGDIVHVGLTAFSVNGVRYQPVDGVGNVTSLQDLARQLRDPAAHGYSAKFDRDLAPIPASTAPTEFLLDSHTLLIEDDDALLAASHKPIQPDVVGVEDILALPVSKLWSWLDAPGKRSDIGQPEILLD